MLWSPSHGARRTFQWCLVCAVLLLLLDCADPVHAGGIASQLPPAVPGNGGVVLDGFGGLHPFGGYHLDTAGAPYWSGFNIARALQLMPGGAGGWVLDGYGGIHAFGAAPPIASPTYMPGVDLARDLVVYQRDGGEAGYVLLGTGQLLPFGGAPALSGYPVWNFDIARGVLLFYTDSVPTGGIILDAWGGLHPFGSAPGDLGLPYHWGRDTYMKLHAVGSAVYAVGSYGVVTGITGPVAPNWSGYVDWGNWNITEDTVLASVTGGSGGEPSSAGAVSAWNAWTGTLPPPPSGIANPANGSQSGGVILDAFGGLHPFGGFHLDTTGAPYWPGVDEARSLVVKADGSGGWELDATGVIHAFGNAEPVASPVTWPGADLARQIVCTGKDAEGNVSCSAGYLLDAWGGVHPWGGAPLLPDPHYVPGLDWAAGLAVHTSENGAPDGLMELGVSGAIFMSGNAPSLPALPPAYPGKDLYLQLSGGEYAPYAVMRYGRVADLSGGRLSPYWSGYGDWGSWDVIRDVVLAKVDNPAPEAQPMSLGALTVWRNAAWNIMLPAAPVRQVLPLDCEAAALQVALADTGSAVSQLALFGAMANDPRPPILGGGSILQWGDPYAAFVGNVYGSEPQYTGYGVYAPEIARIASAFGHPSTFLLGGSPAEVYEAVSEGHPVIVWTLTTFDREEPHHWLAWDGNVVPWLVGEHAVTVVGVHNADSTITVANPETGTFMTFSMASFASWWQTFGSMAVVVT